MGLMGSSSPNDFHQQQHSNGGRNINSNPTPKREKKVGKKRRDPNEPQKPVSAYALFFRDTQATIKGGNPNASFGEVSKIVASMWDQLDQESKTAYKRRTETAKKEYLKALAAYRASLLSLTSSSSSSPGTNTRTSVTSSVPGTTTSTNFNSSQRNACPGTTSSSSSSSSSPPSNNNSLLKAMLM